MAHRTRSPAGHVIGDAIAPPGAKPLPEVIGLARSLVGLPRFAIGGRRALPRGEGPVLVIPGFMTSDRSTLVLRRFLAGLGYEVGGWRLGLNRGDLRRLMPRVAERAERHAAGRPLKLVGWSLGGVIARELARTRPALVDRIVTMGTPVVGGPKYTATAARFAAMGHDLDAIERQVAERNREPVPAPITAIYTRRDQIVAWRACLDDNPDNRVEHVEVRTSHFGLGFDPPTLQIVARVLASPDRGRPR